METLEHVSVRGKGAADIIGGVKSAKLPAEVEEALIARVAELLSAAPPPAPAQSHEAVGRGGFHNTGIVYQDFTSIVDYIPEQVWAYCRECKNRRAILKTAIALGLRRGTEPTYKVLSLCILCCTRGIEYVQNLHPMQRREQAKAVKPQVRLLASYAGSPVVVVDKLPAAPEELKNLQPDLYASVYNSTAPSPNPFDPVAWGMLVSGTRCRMARGSGPVASGCPR